MSHAILKTIRDEHADLRAVLRTLTLLLAQYRREGTVPDFAVLRAMLFYIDAVPQRLHHARESTLLFPRLRLRACGAATLLDRLEREHELGEAYIREVEHALLAFETMGETRRDAFEAAAGTYVDFYLAHMRAEEEHILPLAERSLLARDWEDMEGAFAHDREVLVCDEAADEYRALFSRIVRAVPAPLGLG